LKKTSSRRASRRAQIAREAPRIACGVEEIRVSGGKQENAGSSDRDRRKYFDTGGFVLSDAYLSVIEAIKFSAAKLARHAKITWVNSKDLEKGGTKATAVLKGYDGIIVPGGFGESGIEGKIKAIQFAREIKYPISASATACSSW